ncbi:MAG: ATP-binding cassette domain-containing protein [Chloroflexota bacterium]
MIDLHDVAYWYPNTTAPSLLNVNWHVEAGEFMLVAGPSGSGKSTLLRMVNGLVPHFTGGQVTGRIAVAGQDPVAVGPAQMSRTVGYVAQDPEAQAVLDTVEAEIAFPSGKCGDTGRGNAYSCGGGSESDGPYIGSATDLSITCPAGNANEWLLPRGTGLSAVRPAPG